MVFVQQFHDFWLTGFPLLIDHFFTFFNASIVDIIQQFLAFATLIDLSILSDIYLVFLSSLLELVKLLPFADTPLWQVLLFNFGFIIMLSIAGKILDALPFV